MSTRFKFIIGIIALFTVLLIAEYRMPRKFQWTPTFSHEDPQPFGCLAFDSVLAASMPNGYEVTRKTLWQMEKDSVFASPKAVLIITEEDVDAQTKTMLDLAKQGNIILVATTDLYYLCDTLGIDYSYHYSFSLSDIAGKRPAKGILSLVDTANIGANSVTDHSDRGISLYEQLIERTLNIPDSVPCEILARFRFFDPEQGHRNSHGDRVSFCKPIAAAFPVGKGELILVSSPLLMTNYGMVSGDSHLFIAWMMNRMKHLPVIRTESYMRVTAQTEDTPLYVLLREPPLRWAVYLTMLTILLFCIFTARRRQRVIPVVRRPQNGNVEFASLIGSLYWQQHDNADLLAKKLAYTADELRRQTGINIAALVPAASVSVSAPGASPASSVSAPGASPASSVSAPGAFPASSVSAPGASPASSVSAPGGFPAGGLQQLATLTGRDPEELRLLLRNIHQAASGDYAVSDQELKTFIDELDSLLHSL